VESGEEADKFLACGSGAGVVLGTELGPSVKDAVTVDEEVAGCGVRRGPRNGVHPAAGLGVLAAALALIFLRFR
jgi:hypothetical protein